MLILNYFFFYSTSFKLFSFKLFYVYLIYIRRKSLSLSIIKTGLIPNSISCSILLENQYFSL